MELVVVAALGLALGLLWISSRAAITVCLLDVIDGRVTVRRGGLAPRVLADLCDVAAHPRIVRATLRIVRDHGRAALDVKGAVPASQLQQLRNVVGSVPLARLVNARRRR